MNFLVVSLTDTIFEPFPLYFTPQTWSWWSKKVWTQVLIPTSQTFTLLSDQLETKCVSPGQNATFSTQDAGTLNVPAKLVCCMSQILTEPSSKAITRICDSREKVKEQMGILWPSSICRSFPVVISKILMIPPMALLARNFPSGQYAILRMNFPLMSKEYSFFPLSTSKMFTFPTWVLVARYWELGEKAKVHSSTGPASTDFIYLLFSNCQRRIWASREWDAAMGRVWLKSTNNNSADGSPDSTVGPASHHAISRPSLGHPGILWPLFQSLFCLTLKQLIRWHHHGCALVWREHCTGWSFP